MNEILKMLFREMMRQEGTIKELKTVRDLCKVVWSERKVAEVFAILNDGAELNTEEILEIANDAYQEVCGNAQRKVKNL